MTRRRKILLCVLCGLIAVGAVCVFSNHRAEPSYNGRPLSEWIERFDDYNSSEEEERPERTEARAAVESIGTNGIPSLLKWIVATDSQSQTRLMKFVRAMPPAIRDPWLRQVAKNNAVWKRDVARRGFDILGTNAAPMVPEMMRFFNTVTNGEDLKLLAAIIAETGPAGVKALFVSATNAAVSNQQRAVIVERIEDLCHRGQIDPAMALPVLLTVVEGTDQPSRETALRALGIVKGDPHRLVPVLMRETQRGSANGRAMAALVLRGYGQHARDALPLLQRLSDDTDPQVASAAQGSLDYITQAVLANSGQTNH